MAFRTDEFVSYAGRAGRVRGIESFGAAGASLDVLVIALTGSPGATVRIPAHLADKRLKRISEDRAAALDANPVQPILRRFTKFQRAKLKALRNERLAEAGRLSGIVRKRISAA